MSDVSPTDHRRQCMLECRKVFIKYTGTKPVGGVEALRICRENCDGDDKKRLGPKGDIEATSSGKRPD